MRYWLNTVGLFTTEAKALHTATVVHVLAQNPTESRFRRCKAYSPHELEYYSAVWIDRARASMRAYVWVCTVDIVSVWSLHNDMTTNCDKTKEFVIGCLCRCCKLLINWHINWLGGTLCMLLVGLLVWFPPYERVKTAPSIRLWLGVDQRDIVKVYLRHAPPPPLDPPMGRSWSMWCCQGIS